MRCTLVYIYCRYPFVSSERRFLIPDAGGAYTVSGSANQPTVNGVYHEVALTVYGHAYYTKGTGAYARVLWWWSKYGKWVITKDISAATTNKGFYAMEPNGATPVFGPPRGSGWRTWNKKWMSEASIAVAGNHSPKMRCKTT